MRVYTGRLPVRVELKSLTEDDLRRVLSEKQYNLIKVGGLCDGYACLD